MISVSLFFVDFTNLMVALRDKRCIVLFIWLGDSILELLFPRSYSFT
jgi:hypothetical protein